jgi:hypothetical protein
MHIEHHLAAQVIAKMLAQGYSKECAITQAAKFVKSQGFGAKHSNEVAKQMAELV